MTKSQLGLIGLGTMGTPLARNLASRGFKLSLYNRHVDSLEEYVASAAIQRYPELTDAQGFDNLTAFVESLQTPRIIILMVPEGMATQVVVDSVAALLDKDDILIDAGNSHFLDTNRREESLRSKGIRFLGCGIAGGVEGALHGPSIMAGGHREAYNHVSHFFHAIAAKDLHHQPCSTYAGPAGAGHFAKMVHNGIEYAEMQLIAEIYTLLRWAVGLTPDHIAQVISQWQKTEAASYLLDITVNILQQKEGDHFIIDRIMDTAGHKGTGGWAVQAAAAFGIPAMMITAALHARYLSAQRHIRTHLNDITSRQERKDASLSTNDLFNAYQLARIINYHEGYSILRAASKNYQWNINLSSLSAAWTNGCTIRSAMTNQFATLWADWNDELILHPFIKGVISKGWSGLRRINEVGSTETVFTPCLVAASQYIAGASLWHPAANLIQAQRDYFGNHGFRRTDDPSDTHHHFNWKKS